MIVFYVVLLSSMFFIAVCQEATCERPAPLLDFEESCKTDPEVVGNTGSFLEQVEENIGAAVEHAKRLFNMAKKKLGIKASEETSQEQVKKCEYYQCIFRRMDVLGSNNYPNKTIMDKWGEDNLSGSSKDTTLMKISSCFNAIAMNIANTEYASGFVIEDKSIKFDNPTTDQIPLESSVYVMSSCEVSSKLMMCLNSDMMCPTFSYP